MKHAVYSSPEILEARIAPAGISLVFTSSTNEIETVTVSASKGTMAALEAAVSSAGLTGTTFSGDHLSLTVDLTSSPLFQGTNLTISVAGGASVDAIIDATHLNLGTVVVHGELDRIEAGAGKAGVPAVQKLQADSLGITDHLTSILTGPVTTVAIAGDVGGTLDVFPAFGSIGTLTVGGSLLGGAGLDQGSIIAGGKIGSVSVTGMLQGGAGASSGSIFAGGSIGHASIGGITGGTGGLSGNLSSESALPDVKVAGNITGSTDVAAADGNGRIFAGTNLGKVVVAGSIVGGAADHSGAILAGSLISNITVAGGMTGGAGLQSGTIGAGAAISHVTLGDSSTLGTNVLTGGAGSQSGAVIATIKLGAITIDGSIQGGSGTNSGNIASEGPIASVVVHGSVLGGTGLESGEIGSDKALKTVAIDGALTGGSGEESGRIVSKTTLGSVTVQGNVSGGTGESSGAIGALGAIGTITIHGSLLGGPLDNSGAVQGGAAIAQVSVDGDVRSGGGLQSGVIQAVAKLGMVTIGGDLDATLGGAESAEINSRTAIGTVTIQGHVVGGPSSDSAIIDCSGPIAKVFIGGNLDGSQTSSEEADSAVILTFANDARNPLGYKIGSVIVKGGMLGGGGFATGAISGQSDIGTVTVGTQGTVQAQAFIQSEGGGDLSSGLHGGSGGNNSGTIFAEDKIGQVTIHGSLLGGAGPTSGSIYSSQGRIGKVVIDGSVIGGSGGRSAAIIGGSMGSVTVHGNVEGSGNDSGSMIAQTGSIDSVKIDGLLSSNPEGSGPELISAQVNIGSVSAASIIGNASFGVYITAGGSVNAKSSAQALAIRSVTTAEQMAYTNIWAGYAPGDPFNANGALFNQVNGHVGIGTVEVGTDREVDAPWFENSINAGATTGESGSTEIEGGNPKILSYITKVLVHGTAAGDSDGTATSRTIIADYLKQVTFGSVTVNLQAGPHNDLTDLDASVDPGFTVFLQEIGALAR